MVYVVIGLARRERGLRATPVWLSWFWRLFEHRAVRRHLHDRGRLVTERPAPRRTDPIAAALAFAIREAVRVEAERATLNVSPSRANVVAMKPKPEARVA